MIYFISGPIDISQTDFLLHYQEQLDKALADDNPQFIVGDSDGTDVRAQTYLSDKVDSHNVMVYHTGSRPKNNPWNFRTKGEYRNHTKKDEAMTNASHQDILWIRPMEETRLLYGAKFREGRVSGTEKNQLRRKLIVRLI